MCILFVYIDNNPPEGGYQVIIANNRDEYFVRPTQPAHCWQEEKCCIGGRDAQYGREGGTWIGISTKGKIASLMNILQDGGGDHNMKGRGYLVSNFLKNGTKAADYIKPLVDERDEYNGFNLVLMEKRNDKWELNYYSNYDDSSPCKIESSVSAFGNSIYNRPWQKVHLGKPEFESIVKQFGTTQLQDSLEKALIEFLNNPSPHMPDDVLTGQSRPFALERSCRHVFIKDWEYGTRTNTLILIDGDGTGDYIERTMVEPIKADNPVWNTTRHKFSLN